MERGKKKKKREREKKSETWTKRPCWCTNLPRKETKTQRTKQNKITPQQLALKLKVSNSFFTPSQPGRLYQCELKLKKPVLSEHVLSVGKRYQNCCCFIVLNKHTQIKDFPVKRL